MKVLVTGGAGFIGSHLVDLLLEKGHEVNVMDVWKNKDFLDRVMKLSKKQAVTFEFIKGSILDDGRLIEAMHGCKVVVHLAGILGTNETMFKYRPYDVAEVNVVGTAKVLHHAHKSGSVKRVIFSSTPDVPWVNPYKITKTACEGFIDVYRQHFGDDIVLLRLRNVYGPRERWLEMDTNAMFIYQKVVPTFIYRALRDEPLFIFGDGAQSSDYIYVKDVARCIEGMMRASPLASGYHYIPVGTCKSTSVERLADMIISLTKSESKKQYLPMRQGEVFSSVTTDPHRMRETLRIDPKSFTSLTDGLIKTIEWVKETIK